MSWQLDWVVAATAGGILGVAGKYFWGLVKRLMRSPSAGGATDDLLGTVYLEPSRAKEILNDLARKREETLKEIDNRYADRRRDFLQYLDAQREQIIRDLRDRQARESVPPRGGGESPPRDPAKGTGSAPDPKK